MDPAEMERMIEALVDAVEDLAGRVVQLELALVALDPFADVGAFWSRATEDVAVSDAYL